MTGNPTPTPKRRRGAKRGKSEELEDRIIPRKTSQNISVALLGSNLCLEQTWLPTPREAISPSSKDQRVFKRNIGAINSKTGHSVFFWQSSFNREPVSNSLVSSRHSMSFCKQHERITVVGLSYKTVVKTETSDSKEGIP